MKKDCVSKRGKGSKTPRFGCRKHTYSVVDFCFYYDHKEITTTAVIQRLTEWKLSAFRVFLVCVFWHSGIMRRFTISVFSLSAGKYEPEKLQIRKHFTQCIVFTWWDHWPQSYQDFVFSLGLFDFQKKWFKKVFLNKESSALFRLLINILRILR